MLELGGLLGTARRVGGNVKPCLDDVGHPDSITHDAPTKQRLRVRVLLQDHIRPFALARTLQASPAFDCCEIGHPQGRYCAVNVPYAQSVGRRKLSERRPVFALERLSSLLLLGNASHEEFHRHAGGRFHVRCLTKMRKLASLHDPQMGREFDHALFF